MINQLVVGFLDNEVTDVITNTHMTATECEHHFPIGKVYMYSKEPQGMQWRDLQRSFRTRRRGLSTIRGTFAQLLPLKDEQVPDIVRMVALVQH